MIDRQAKTDHALVLLPQFADMDSSRAEARLEEACGLAEALDLVTAEARIEPVRKLDAGAFFGKGKLDSLKERVDELEAGVVIIDAALSPVQQRNLEKRLNAKVVDRTGLILEIFGRRAQTREGRLQVELARLSYERSRLVRTWTHLERQRGGRGFLAGPGESQIETDRRLLSNKMAKLRRELDEVVRTRTLHRKRRQAAPWPTVALVGYTNAGKSTLFNRLSEAQVLAKDMPFATLDPTVRAIRTGTGRKLLISDTVGFITDLPTELIAAFRATLEEVREADVLIHVRDMADPDHEGRKADVLSVLEALGAGAEAGQTLIEAWNKADRLDDEAREDLIWRARVIRPDAPRAIPVSAITGEGVEALLSLVDEALGSDDFILRIKAGPDDGAAIAWLHENGEILDERTDPETGQIHAVARLGQADAGRFKVRFPGLGQSAKVMADG
ncbi:GTPase HflX [Alkalicaulis satelles]|uniref:GTPase HflX n=1 Tax=Alkalicaulis satelles TaxID=2609175 RepID=A0A5M6ZR73_9PROT|nr:GTPase HflX [Alkalicaulis satelles]KAA5804781.1 GTPase HflX [Alkalicaulis satelles]